MHILSYGVNIYRTNKILISGIPDSLGVYREKKRRISGLSGINSIYNNFWSMDKRIS